MQIILEVPDRLGEKLQRLGDRLSFAVTPTVPSLPSNKFLIRSNWSSLRAYRHVVIPFCYLTVTFCYL